MGQQEDSYSRRFVKLVSDAADSQHISRVLRISLQFLSQAIDVWVDVALITFVVGAPDVVQKRIPGPGAAGFRGQQLQNLKLKRREVNTLTLPAHLMATLVDYQVSNFYALTVPSLGNCTRAPEQRIHSIFQLTRAERLREIVVGPGLETGDLIIERIVGGQE